MNNSEDIRCTKTHEWVRREGDKLVVGITDFAQRRLSDVIHVELPEPDDHHYEEHEDISAIESLKLSIELHAPVPGYIAAINSILLSRPELINEDPYGEGWVVEMKPDNMDDIENLVDLDVYEATLPEDEDDEE